jgi:hypothetical protein
LVGEDVSRYVLARFAFGNASRTRVHSRKGYHTVGGVPVRRGRHSLAYRRDEYSDDMRGHGPQIADPTPGYASAM